MSWHKGWVRSCDSHTTWQLLASDWLELFNTLPSSVAATSVWVPREMWSVGEQDGGLDCLTVAAVWSGDREGSPWSPCCWLQWLGDFGRWPWLNLHRGQNLHRGSSESGQPDALTVGPSGYSRNLPRGRNLAQLWPHSVGHDWSDLAAAAAVPLGSLRWLAQHLWQESLAPSQGSVEVAKRMGPGGPLVTVESCHTTYQLHDLGQSVNSNTVNSPIIQMKKLRSIV